MTIVTDEPVVGWREACARNRVDGALHAAHAAVSQAMTIAADESNELPQDVYGRVHRMLMHAMDDVEDAQSQLRERGKLPQASRS